MGKWRCWDPSLQAPELKNSQVSQDAPTEPRQSSSALVFFSFSQSCPSFPAEMEPQGSQVGWQLCCAFRILFSKCCNPTLGWLGLARCSVFPWAVKHPALESHPSDPGAGTGLWPWQLSRLGELRAVLSQKVQNCSAKFVISAGNV